MAKGKRTIYEVQPRKSDGKWLVVMRGTNGGLISEHETKVEAVQAGMVLGRAAHPWGQLIIKKRDGKIQEERTYGNDPRRSKG